MKKLLALVLALVMSLSLVTISSADFKDADKIDYNEAVDVMNAVGVFIGDDNGNFNPKANLERAQAAKIVAYLLLGNKTAEGLAGSGKFTDVAKTNWAAGFIDYCAATGVVAGVGNGKFDPNGSLTTLQFAKMLLVALGYDAKIEGFTGNDWSINVSAKANQVGLLDGLDVGANATLTREQAAKMALNTLKSPLVEYDTKGTTVTVGGDASVTVGASKAEFKTSTNKKAQTISNDVINGTTAYTVEFAEEYYSDLKLEHTTDAFGRPANKWKYKTEELGTYADDSDLIKVYDGVKASRGDLYNLIGSGAVEKLQTSKPAADNYFEVYVDGQKLANPTIGNFFVKNSTTASGNDFSVNSGVSGNGVLTEVYMDNDNNVRIVVVYTYLMQATADYNSTKGTLNVKTVDNGVKPTGVLLPTTIDNDDVNVEGIKEDDYILVTYDRVNKEVKSAVKAEILTGEVTEYTKTDDVTIGGTKYEYNKLVGISDDGQSGTEFTIKEKATVVLDKYGYIIYVDDALASNSYVFILETAKAVGVGNRVAADAYFTDGTNDSIIIKKVNGDTDLASKTGAKGKWFTYSKDANGEYSLNKVKSTVTLATDDTFGTSKTVIESNKVNFMPNATAKYANGSKNVADIKGNSSTVFVVAEADGTVTTATGIKNAPDVTTGKTAIASPKYNAKVFVSVKNTGDYAEYVFVDLTNDVDANVDGSENAADYMLLLKKTDNITTDVNNDKYYKYKVLFDGVETEKYIAETTLTAADATGLLFRNVKENSKGYVTSAKLFEDNVYDPATGNMLANPGKRVVIDLDGKKVSIDKETLTLGATDVYAEKANVTLLIGKNANADLIDQGKDYQLYDKVSAKAAASYLKDFTLDKAKAYVVLDDDANKSDVAVSIYIFVEQATSPANNGNGGGNGGNGGGENGPDGVKLTGEYKLPDDSDLAMTSSDVPVDAVYDANTNTVKVQITGIGNIAKGTYTIQLTDSKGKTTTKKDIEVPFGNGVNGSDKSKDSQIIAISFTPNEKATSIDVKATLQSTQSFYVTYNVTGLTLGDKQATVANKVGEKITFNINAPKDAYKWGYTVSDGATSSIQVTSPAVGVTALGTAVTGVTEATAKVVVEMQTPDTPPVVEIDGPTVAEYNLTVSSNNMVKGAGVEAVIVADVKSANSGSATNVNVRALLTNALSTRDKVVVAYKLDGADKTMDITGSTTDENGNISIPNATKAVKLEITSVTVFREVNSSAIAALSGTASNTTGASAKVLNADGTDFTTGTAVAVGDKLTIEVTPGTVSGSGVKFTFNGESKTVAAGSTAKVTFTYTVVDGTNALAAVAQANA